MKIAIVENIQEEALLLSEKIKCYMEEKQLTYELFRYFSGESFADSLSSNSYDIVFMDIYMEKMTGIEAARILRRWDKNCKLIFLTNTEEYARQGYSVNASHYLLKPIQDELFLEAMDNCQLKLPSAVPFLDVTIQGSTIHLDTQQLMYIYVHGRNVELHMVHQTLMTFGSFSKLTAPLLQDSRFLIPIRGMIINMEYISTHDNESAFILTNGDRIPINLRNKKKVLQKWRNYIFNQFGGE